MRQRGVDRHKILLAIRDAPVVLTPRHFGCVGIQVRTGDVVMRADFGAPQAREERLGLIGAGFAVAVGLLVVDALGQIARVQRVPVSRFVGVND